MKKKFFSLLAMSFCLASSTLAEDVTISSASELKNFATRVNNGETSLNATLTADIDLSDLSDETWTPIGTSSVPFKGTFDGQNHAITNFNYTATGTHNGLFGNINGATVQKFSISGTLTSSYTKNGVIGEASNWAKVKGIHSSLTMDLNNTKGYSGGIVGGVNWDQVVTIENCEYDGTMTHTGTGDCQGGIIGYTWHAIIKNCLFSGKITGDDNTNYGGIVGANCKGSYFTVQNCLCIGTVTASSSTKVGAIIGNYAGNTTTKVTNNYYKAGSATAAICGNTSYCEAPTVVTAEQLTSGEVAYLLNGSVSGGTNWTQTIGTDANPSPIGSSIVRLAKTGCYTNLSVSDSKVQIGTAADLVQFAKEISVGNTATDADMTADIALSNAWTTPIGTSSVPFKGTFDGQNHAITGFDLTYDGGRQGLFGQTNGATIKNFSIGGTITANGNGGKDSGVGVIAWAEASTIQNIHSSLTVDATGSGLSNTHVGGVVGSLRQSSSTGSTIDRCSFTGEMNGGSNKIDCFGCVVGYLHDNCVISNCANYGTLTITNTEGNSGGILAYSWMTGTAKIENCLNVGSINCNKTTNGGGAIVGWLRSYDSNKLSNNYWLSGTGSQAYGGQTDGSNTATEVTADQLASGEVAYLLNGSVSGGTNWTQTIGTDANPSPIGSSIVRLAKTGCYTNLSVSDSKVQIGTAADLVQFAKEINVGNTATDADMTADIALSDAWTTPIGNDSKKYSGTFDGQGHAITGFSMETANDNKKQGLFGTVNGATIKDFSIAGSIKVLSESVGVGVVAWAEASTMQDIHSSLTITATDGAASGHVGGVVGSLQKNNHVEHCSFSGQMNGGSNKIDCFGCVVGYMNDGSVISNCANYGKLTYSGSEGNAGGILAYTWANGGGKIENCLNIGEIDYNKSGNGGAIVGCLKLYADRVSNNYILEGSASQAYGGQNDSGNTCTSVTAAQLASGEVCFGLGSAWYQTLGTDNYPQLDSSKPSVDKLVVTDAGYASFVPTVNVAAVPEGVTAYVGQINGDRLHLEPVTELPADNAFIVKAEEGNYYYNNTDEEKTLAESNDLKFYTEATAADGTQYCLANKAQGVGFYIVASGTTIPAYKVYLKPAVSIKAFYGFDEDATGIAGFSEHSDYPDTIHNLAGQRLGKTQKGINIINGRKVLK